MPSIRLLFLWHMHQPYYKDLVSGEYRLPWVRLHALKDYYGMVKLLDEFPGIHQTFNLVPSLIAQMQDYVSGSAHDPFLALASRPASDLGLGGKEFALEYLFQGNLQNMIGRYPRYRELWERFQNLSGDPLRAAPLLKDNDFTDLQVLSQIAWFDEFWLQEPEVRELIKKERGYTHQDQEFVIGRQKDFLAQVLPAYSVAQQRGAIEISTSPFYHPILPLVCDTNAGAASHPGLPLPAQRFRHPEDAREQIVRGLALHEQVFGVRPRGMWPSEGSVSNDVLALAHGAGIEWMATDEGVLGRSLGTLLRRDAAGNLDRKSAEKLYRIYQWQQGNSDMHLVFRDHSLSDLIGFVYSGVSARDAAEDFIHRIKAACAPLLEQGKDAVVSIILDGENAWEYYPRSGREFLRRLYDGIQEDKTFEALTVSESLGRSQTTEKLTSIVPGSWINGNFDVWIGAPEDNLAWDHLSSARDFFTANAERVADQQKQLAFEELLISEGSDWNWWYGPEHHSANDRDFDELYRKHLSNVYQALGATPPDYLAQPISGAEVRPSFIPQTAYIHPRVAGDKVRYFEWMGAAIYSADHRAGAMHGKQFLLDSVYAGIDSLYLYGRLDFAGKVPTEEFEIVVNVESWASGEARPRRTLRVETTARAGTLAEWRVENGVAEKVLASSKQPDEHVKVALLRNFEFKVPLTWLLATPGAVPAEPTARKSGVVAIAPTSKLRLRFSLWQNRLPVDSLPLEGWIELQAVSEGELLFGA